MGGVGGVIQAMDGACDIGKKSGGDRNGKNDKESTLQERERISYISFPFVSDSLKYDGLNLMHWSQSIELILNGHGLKDHLTNPVSPGDPRYKMCEQEDSLVHGWLLGKHGW